MNNKEQVTIDFTIGCIGKHNLALLYYPDLEEKAAINALSRTIRNNEELRKSLEALPSYNKFSHSYTPKEIEIIQTFLGPPTVSWKK
ncbi:DUF4248 domain-containing protein [Phocaeicola sp.]